MTEDEQGISGSVTGYLRTISFSREDEREWYYILHCILASAGMEDVEAVEATMAASVVRYMSSCNMPSMGEFMKIASRVYMEVDDENRDNEELPRIPIRRGRA